MSSPRVDSPSGFPSSIGHRVPGGPFVVVAVIAVAALLISVGVAVLVTSGNAPPATGAVTFYAARSAAASELGPGNWSLYEALGFDFWNGTSLSTSGTSYPPNCTVSTYPSVLPSSLEFPAFRGSLSDGSAAVWVLGYLDVAGHSDAGVVVTHGVVTEAFTLSGPTCPISTVGLVPISPGTVDSSTAAGALDTAGASNFLAGHREGTTLMMTLFGGFAQIPSQFSPTWNFDYSPCSGLLTGNISGPANGVGFAGTVNATTGEVMGASEQSANCVTISNTTSPPGIYQAIMFGPAEIEIGPGTGGTLASQGCASGEYCYSLPVEQAQMNVTPNDLGLWVQNGTGVPSLVPRGYAFLDSQGNVLVYSTGAVESAWTDTTGTGNTPLVAGDTLVIDMGPSDPYGMGYWLNIQGEGPFAGSGLGFGLP